MITKIKIKNFETWIDQEFDLHPGLTVLTGESDQGKSGIIRAIKWNSFNRPQGDNFRNDTLTDKKESVSVSITYSDDTSIIRSKNNSGKNNYIIEKNGKELKTLTALRTDVPQEIFDISKTKAVNIQGQHPTEQYFLLAETPGQVAKEFNKVSGLTIMDKAMYEINHDIRETKSELDVYTKTVNELSIKIQEMEWVEKAEKFSKKLYSVLTELLSKQERVNQIKIIIGKIQEIENKLKELRDIPSALEKLEKLFNAQQKINRRIEKIEKIKYFIGKIKIIGKELHKLNQIPRIKQELEIIDTKILSYNIQNKKVTELENIIKRGKIIISNLYKLNNIPLAIQEMKKIEKIVQSIQSQKTRITTLGNKVENLVYIYDKLRAVEEDYLRAYNEYSKIRENQQCPVCGRSGRV